MGRRTWFFGVFLLLLVAPTLHAGSPQAGISQPEILKLESLDSPCTLDDGWRYLRQDDPAYALPGTDDSAWEVTSLSEFDPPPNPSEVIWFRREIEITDSSRDHVIAASIGTYGIVEVYFDGRPLLAMDREGAGRFTQLPVPRLLHPADAGRHLIAVRIDPGPSRRYLMAVGYGNPVGFVLRLGNFDSLLAESMRKDRRISRLLFLAGLLFAASITAGLITLKLPLLSMNRSFFGFTLSGSLLMLALQLFRLSLPAQGVGWLMLLMELLVLTTFISALIFLQEATDQHRPKTILGLVILSLITITISIITRHDITFIHYILIALELLRTILVAAYRPHKGTSILLAGFGLFLAAEFLHWGSFWGLFPEVFPGILLSLVAVLGPTLAMIALFVFRYADLHWEVQNKIRRMQELSSRALLHEQELRTKEREALEMKVRYDHERLNTVQKLAITIAHEFNTPLTTLSLMAETLIRPSSSEGLKRETLNRLPSMVERLKKLAMKLMQLRTLKEVDYITGVKMLDLDHSEESNKVEAGTRD